MSVNNGSLQHNSTSQQNGTSTPEPSLCGRGFYWPIHGPLIVFVVFILAANGVVIALMFWKETLRTLSNLFLASLAVSDLLFGLVGIPVYLACSAGTSLTTCVLSTLIVRFTAVSSMFHLLLIATDRYIMIVHSLEYPALITRLRAIVAIFVLWLVALTSTIIQMAWFDVDKSAEGHQAEDEVYFVFMFAFFFIPLLLMLYMYGHIFSISLRHILAVRRRRRNLDQPVLPIVHDLRGSFILVSMMLIFVCCWLPFFLLILQDHIKKLFFLPTQIGLCFILYLRFIPPLSNPILCAFCKQDFRRALCRLLRYQEWPTKVRFRSRASTFSSRERKEMTASTLNDTITERSTSARESAALPSRVSVEVSTL